MASQGLSLISKFLLRLPADNKVSDLLLGSYLDAAGDFICDCIDRDEVPPRLESLQLDLAMIALNKMGAEGESSRSEGGISRAFDDLPKHITERLKSYPKRAYSIHRKSGV